MAIGIECPECHERYNVNDGLAGKKVRCKSCSSVITVPGGDAAPAMSGGGKAGSACPSCGSPVAPGAKKCAECGFSFAGAAAPAAATPRKVINRQVADPGGDVIPHAPAPRKKRKFVRDPDHPTLASIDGLVKMIVILVTLAGVTVWIIHVAQRMESMAALYLLPLGIALVMFAAIAGVMSFAVKFAAKFVEFIPREDTYTRCLVAILLPLSLSLLGGWKGLDGSLAGTLITLSWVLAPAILIYLLRGELVEWIATVVAAGLGLGVSAGVLSFILGAAAPATANLYAELIPSGPWAGIATGHVPEAPATQKTAVATSASATTQQVAKGPDTQAGPTTKPDDHDVKVAEGPKVAPGQEDETGPVKSDALRDIVATPELTSISETVTCPIPSQMMLVVKREGSTATIQRWEVNPPHKTGETTCIESPKQPNMYSLSPRGDLLVTLVEVPRKLLRISSFDNKMTKREINLQNDAGIRISMLGFTMRGYVCIRKDLGGTTTLQVWNAYTGDEVRNIKMDMVVNNPALLKISPTGQTVAALGNDQQIMVYSLTNSQLLRRFPAASQSFVAHGLAFSPDGTQLAFTCGIDNVLTIMTFTMPNYAPGFSGVLDTPVVRTETEDRLSWVGDQWIVNGDDIYDAGTGKKLTSLKLKNTSEKIVAGSTLAFLRPLGDTTVGKTLTFAKLNEDVVKKGAN